MTSEISSVSSLISSPKEGPFSPRLLLSFPPHFLVVFFRFLIVLNYKKTREKEEKRRRNYEKIRHLDALWCAWLCDQITHGSHIPPPFHLLPLTPLFSVSCFSFRSWVFSRLKSKRKQKKTKRKVGENTKVLYSRLLRLVDHPPSHIASSCVVRSSRVTGIFILRHVILTRLVHQDSKSEENLKSDVWRQTLKEPESWFKAKQLAPCRDGDGDGDGQTPNKKTGYLWRSLNHTGPVRY